MNAAPSKYSENCNFILRLFILYQNFGAGYNMEGELMMNKKEGAG